MRVAVHFTADHPLSGGEESVAAYRLGRIEDGVHNAPLGFDPVALEDYVANAVKAAQDEFPGASVVVERLVDNGDGTSSWIPADEFDPEEHTPVGAGAHVEREISASLHASGGDE